MELLQKAFVVYHDGMLGYPPEKYSSIEEIDVVYAKTASKAKSLGGEAYDWMLNSDDYPSYLDLKAKRMPNMDKVLYDGREIYRHNAQFLIDVEIRTQKRIESVNRYPDGTFFYIQKGFVGNSVLFWALDSCGYTTNIDNAQVYSKEKVLKDFVTHDWETVIWPADHVNEKVKKHVDSQYLSRSKSC